MKPVQIGIVGCGTVGTGVTRLLVHEQELIRRRLGFGLDLKRVADLDMATDRGVAFQPGVFIQDAWQVVRDPDIDIIVETIGGETLAGEIIAAAIEQGKHVVTANKALLAKHGNRLFSAAEKKGVDLAFEASVCGCMPVIKTLRETLAANRVETMFGIFNGTCNYILSKITEERIPFEQALAEAQAQGYAEADPTLDIEGLDTAHKLAILTALAYGMQINFDDIYIEGISGILPSDIRFAEEFGYRIKLLAISKDHGDQVEARVHPTMIPCDNILSNVSGPLNAITIGGTAVGDLFLSGHGAGMMPTASAVLSDLADIARNIRRRSSGRVALRGFQPDQIRKRPIMPMDEIVTHYYIRFAALDRPGVLASIAGILGKLDISIKSVHQKGPRSNSSVPIVMLTHKAREAGVQDALKQIAALDVVADTPVLIRIEDNSEPD
jgi:homoserine dehydrogenase